MLYRKITSSVAIGVTMLIAGGGAALAEVPTSGTPSQPTSDGGVVPTLFLVPIRAAIAPVER
jgi:hypothetical protein